MTDETDEKRARTRPSAETRDEEAREAGEKAAAGRPPTDDEERAADRNPALDPEVSEHYEEMVERGAKQRGEGRVP